MQPIFSYYGLMLFCAAIILHFVELKADFFEFRREHLLEEAEEERREREEFIKKWQEYYEKLGTIHPKKKYNHNLPNNIRRSSYRPNG